MAGHINKAVNRFMRNKRSREKEEKRRGESRMTDPYEVFKRNKIIQKLQDDLNHVLKTLQISDFLPKEMRPYYSATDGFNETELQSIIDNITFMMMFGHHWRHPSWRGIDKGKAMDFGPHKQPLKINYSFIQNGDNADPLKLKDLDPDIWHMAEDFMFTEGMDRVLMQFEHYFNIEFIYKDRIQHAYNHSPFQPVMRFGFLKEDKPLCLNLAGMCLSAHAHSFLPCHGLTPYPDIWFSEGHYDHATMAHEIMHALGLMHPSDFRFGEYLGLTQSLPLDNRIISNVSINPVKNTNTVVGLADFMALRRYYGDKPSSYRGDHIYCLALKDYDQEGAKDFDPVGTNAIFQSRFNHKTKKIEHVIKPFGLNMIIDDPSGNNIMIAGRDGVVLDCKPGRYSHFFLNTSTAQVVFITKRTKISKAIALGAYGSIRTSQEINHLILPLFNEQPQNIIHTGTNHLSVDAMIFNNFEHKKMQRDFNAVNAFVRAVDMDPLQPMHHVTLLKPSARLVLKLPKMFLRDFTVCLLQSQIILTDDQKPYCVSEYGFHFKYNQKKPAGSLKESSQGVLRVFYPFHHQNRISRANPLGPLLVKPSMHGPDHRTHFYKLGRNPALQFPTVKSWRK
jgi:hypothetical protein